MSTLQVASTLGLGLLAGVHHALSGPDHMAGVAPLAAQNGREGWRVGLGWGLGHAAGAILAALVALILREQLPGVETSLSAVSETLVGMLLCAVGLLGLRRALGWRSRAHAHVGAAPSAGHAHFVWFAAHRHAPDRGSSRSRRAAFTLGLFHGAAGLSHLFAVLPALALPGIWLPAAYLAGYAGGSLIAIVGFATALGRLAKHGASPPRRWVLGLASATSLAVGILWIVRPL